jgi:hypothetical protein
MIIVLSNRGMGPADVTAFELLIDGAAPMAHGLTRYEQVTSHLGLPSGTILSFLQPPETIAVGQEVDLVAVPLQEYTPELADRVQAAFRRIGYRIQYSSSDGSASFLEKVSGRKAFPERSSS